MMSELILSEIVEGLNGQFGHITLNRPQALNALNIEMIVALDNILETWEKDPKILAVIIRSSSEKAFCAGGDIRAVYKAKLTNDHAEVLKFFEREYTLNSRIRHYSKPYISFMNGITMGGGVGISLHGSHTIAGENFIFAMPETAIGFFPDIGAGYLLGRCPYASGNYLGITGARINRNDAYSLNLITHCINMDDQTHVIEKIYQIENNLSTTHQQITDILSLFHQPATMNPIFKRSGWINDIFFEESIEKMIILLEKEMYYGDPIREKALYSLKNNSPLSLKVTYDMLELTRFESFDTCIEMNKTLLKHFLQGKDFYEGIRAVIVDKDNQPQWNPAKLEDVSRENVKEYFRNR